MQRTETDGEFPLQVYDGLIGMKGILGILKA